MKLKNRGGRVDNTAPCNTISSQPDQLLVTADRTKAEPGHTIRRSYHLKAQHVGVSCEYHRQRQPCGRSKNNKRATRPCTRYGYFIYLFGCCLACSPKLSFHSVVTIIHAHHGSHITCLQTVFFGDDHGHDGRNMKLVLPMSKKKKTRTTHYQ